MDDVRLIFEPERLKRASRHAAIISGIGFLIVFLVFAIGIMRLRTLSGEIQSKKQEIESQKQEIGSQKETIDSRQKTIESQKKEIDRQKKEIQEQSRQIQDRSQQIQDVSRQIDERQTKLASLEKDLATATRELETQKQEVENRTKEVACQEEQIRVLRGQTDKLTASLQEHKIDVPLTVIKPKASVGNLSPEEATKYGSEYAAYSLWIEAPDDVKKNIDKVTYYMNHPTFPQPLLEGTDRGNNFRAGYPGCGALSNVIVTVRMKDKNEIKLDFNQQQALEDKRQRTPQPSTTDPERKTESR